jgi:hypothetical protein
VSDPPRVSLRILPESGTEYTATAEQVVRMARVVKLVLEILGGSVVEMRRVGG